MSLCSVSWHLQVNYKANSFIIIEPGNTKGGSIVVRLTSCLTGLESAVGQLTIFAFICKTDQCKPVKQEVNSKVILPPLVFPDCTIVFPAKKE
jgi:hypothetical protein